MDKLQTLLDRLKTAQHDQAAELEMMGSDGVLRKIAELEGVIGRRDRAHAGAENPGPVIVCLRGAMPAPISWVTVPSRAKPTTSICLREATSAPEIAKTITPNQSR